MYVTIQKCQQNMSAVIKARADYYELPNLIFRSTILGIELNRFNGATQIISSCEFYFWAISIIPLFYFILLAFDDFY